VICEPNAPGARRAHESGATPNRASGEAAESVWLRGAY